MQKDTHELLTAAQLAQEIQVGRRTIGAWTKSRRIPALKLGRRCVRYDLQRVRDALAKFEQEAIQ
ncbi:MAG TPA: helix-turn-helix domain-containing protein [Prosthecobacter sp.]|nr:helix-turn-helix domain-containing protein [Prosthecobacter sp.]